MNSTEPAVAGRELLNGSLDVMRLAVLKNMALYGYQIDKQVRAAVAAFRHSTWKRRCLALAYSLPNSHPLVYYLHPGSDGLDYSLMRGYSALT